MLIDFLIHFKISFIVKVMENKSEITKRILETKKDTELLKTQLQNLIDAGLKSSNTNKVAKETACDKENVNVKPNLKKIQIIKSYNVEHSKHVDKAGPSYIHEKQTRRRNQETEVTEESPKKTRGYDVQKAREYIKKQQEQRMQYKKIKNDDKIKAELKKQKLQELQKKSLELVTKNVQAKRERSRSASRERTGNNVVNSRSNICTRVDKTYINPPDAGHSLNSCQHLKNTSTKEEKDNKNPTKDDADEVIASLSNIALQKITIRGSSRENNVKDSKTNFQNIPNTSRNKQFELTNVLKSCSEVVNQNLTNNLSQNSDVLQPTNLFNVLTQKAGENEVKVNKSNSKITRNLLDTKILKRETATDHKPKELCNKILEAPLFKIGDIKLTEPQKFSENANKNESLKNSKYKTEKIDPKKPTSKNIPEWLKEKPEGYPYNFINTVKRKLQYTTFTPIQSKDVGVQMSNPIEDNLRVKTPENVLNREEILEKLQNSVKSSKKTSCNFIFPSYASHNREHLDQKPLICLELITNPSCKTHTEYPSESESDTSKNIPDISSESSGSLKKQLDFPAINLEKIKEIKLNSKNSFAISERGESECSKSPKDFTALEGCKLDIKRSLNNLKECMEQALEDSAGKKLSDTIITDCFANDDLELSLESRRKRRESIKSFNSPTYNSNRSANTSSPEVSSFKNKTNSVGEIDKIITDSSDNSEKIIVRNKKSNKKPHINVPKIVLTNESSDFIETKLISSPIQSDKSSSSTKHEEKLEMQSVISGYLEKNSNTSKRSTNSQTKSQFNSDFSKKSYLYTEFSNSEPLKTKTNTEKNLSFINTSRGSSENSASDKLTEVLPLRTPTVTLNFDKKMDLNQKNRVINNISLRSNPDDLNTNEIHLKFEAEIHLLNDFNNSLRQFRTVEKAFESLKSQNDSRLTESKILQNADTQTSIITKTSTVTKFMESVRSITNESQGSEVSSINFSRGSIMDPQDNNLNLDETILKENESILTGVMELTDIERSEVSSAVFSTKTEISNIENLPSGNLAGVSLSMFEQLIKDEDARLENLKTILKIREQALLDRTRGELVWLEIQRKQLKETGELQKASLIKKKQRGILVNLQKEKHEMQRLKQMQKAASKERKTILKEQQSLIKNQLMTDNMLQKVKISKSSRERRLSGPLKVIQSRTGSIRSETSISKLNSSHKDNITLTEDGGVSEVEMSPQSKRISERGELAMTQTKKTLLRREAILQKRKKAAEELLKWHQKLLKEEEKVIELEAAANTIISRIPSVTLDSKPQAPKGEKLNQLWSKVTRLEGKSHCSKKTHKMSQKDKEIPLIFHENNSLKSSRESSSVTNEKSNDRVNKSYELVPEVISTKSELNCVKIGEILNEYVSDFEQESVLEPVSNRDVINQSLHELISTFAQVKEDISSLSILKSKNDKNIDTEEEASIESLKTDEGELSVIGTVKTSTSFGESEERSSKNSNKDLVDPMKDNNITVTDILCQTEQILEQLNQFENGNLPKDPQTTVFNKESVGEILDNSIKSMTISTSSISEKSQEKLMEGNQSSQGVLLGSEINLEESFDQSEKLSESVQHVGSLKNVIEVSENIDEKSNDSNFTNLLYKNHSIETEISSESINSAVSSFNKAKELSKSKTDESEFVMKNCEFENVQENLAKSSESLKIPTVSPTKDSKDLSSFNKKLFNELELNEAFLDKTKNQILETEKNEDHEFEESLIETNIDESLLFEEYNTEEFEEKSEQINLSIKEMETTTSLENLKYGSHNNILNNDEENEEQMEGIVGNFNGNSSSLFISQKVDLKKSQNEPKESVSPQKCIEIQNVEAKSVLFEKDISEKSSKAENKEKLYSVCEKSFEENEQKSNSVSEKSFEVSSDGLQLPKEKSTSFSEKIIETEQEEIVDELKQLKDVFLNQSVSLLDNEQFPDIIPLEEDECDIDSTPTKTADIMEDNEVLASVAENDKENPTKETNSFEEKEQDSLSSSATTSLSEIITEKDECADLPSKISHVTLEKSKTKCDLGEKSPQTKNLDVKKRVLEILDASQQSWGDKSPRLQDLYTTTYDLISPADSPELGSPKEENQKVDAKAIFGNEAEEILRKQLAIEQEIKQITEQQQKEQAPYVFVREIPNKPPPPYKPPQSLTTANVPTILPTVEEIDEIAKYSAKILHKAYISNNLHNISISENTLGLISKNITKECYKFVFDLCKDIARDHYDQFRVKKCSPWLQVTKKAQLAIVSPFDSAGLEKHLKKNLKEVFSYDKPQRQETAIIKWSRKKRDHVDEILVMESQMEEKNWTNYDKDELIVKNEVTKDIMNMLLKETAQVFSRILLKRNLCQIQND